MRKKIVGFLSIAVVIAIVTVVWWRGRSSSAKSDMLPKPSEASMAPAPARTSVVLQPTAIATAEPTQTVAATPQAVPEPMATQPVSPTSSSTPPTTVSDSTSPTPIETTLINEEMATRRMYAAHAPLRTPEVADPDSKSNKRILVTMLQKALAQPAAQPPITPATR